MDLNIPCTSISVLRYSWSCIGGFTDGGSLYLLVLLMPQSRKRVCHHRVSPALLYPGDQGGGISRRETNLLRSESRDNRSPNIITEGRPGWGGSGTNYTGSERWDPPTHGNMVEEFTGWVLVVVLGAKVTTNSPTVHHLTHQKPLLYRQQYIVSLSSDKCRNRFG